jgi:type III pantothenate kinase
MIVTVDAGNTRVKVALTGPSGVKELFDVPTLSVFRKRRVLAKSLDALVKQLRGVEGAALCSVAPEVDRVLESELERVTGRSVLVLRSGSRFPFAVGVADRGRVGMDRLAAAAGALGDRRARAIVVDVGSAITVDLVLGNRFRGGLIMPGPRLGLRALGEYARRLPLVDLDRIRSAGHERFDDTVPSMILGARAGTIGAIMEAVRVLRKAARVRAAVFLTGGAAPFVSDGLPAGWKRDPHLVAKGLYRLWMLNGPAAPRAPKKNA